MKRTETCFTDRSEDEAYLAFVLNELKERYGQKKGGIFLGESKKGNEGKALLQRAGKAGLNLSEYSYRGGEKYDYYVDAFADGYPQSKEEYNFISFYNSLKGKKTALEIPSGIEPSNGSTDEGNFAQSDSLVGYAPLTGLYLQDGLDAGGEKTFFREGTGGISVLEEKDFQGILPPLKRNTNKGDYPKCALVGGSSLYPGAFYLSLLSKGAYRFGSGYTYIVSNERVLSEAVRLNPQALPVVLPDEDGFLLDDKEKVKDLARKVSCVLFGNGVGANQKTYALLRDFMRELSEDQTLIVDADGLNLISLYGEQDLKERSCRLILTPHLKEFSRLCRKSLDEIKLDPVGLGKAFAREYGCTLVLKSASTLIFSPEGEAHLSAFGNSGLAKAGSGDLLAGLTLGSSLILNDPVRAAELACYLLGKSAEIYARNHALRSLVYSDVIDGIGTLLKGLEK